MPGGKFKTCSVGYPGTDSAGNRYFITAGHCFRTSAGSHYVHKDGSGLDIYGPDDSSTPIGWEKLFTNLNAEGYFLDVSLVQMRPGKKLAGDGWPDIAPQVSSSSVGDTACAVGQRHNKPTCGEVTAVGTEIRMTGYPWKSIVNRATYCSFPGDSGGLVYNNTGSWASSPPARRTPATIRTSRSRRRCARSGRRSRRSGCTDGVLSLGLRRDLVR